MCAIVLCLKCHGAFPTNSSKKFKTFLFVIRFTLSHREPIGIYHKTKLEKSFWGLCQSAVKEFIAHFEHVERESQKTKKFCGGLEKRHGCRRYSPPPDFFLFLSTVQDTHKVRPHQLATLCRAVFMNHPISIDWDRRSPQEFFSRTLKIRLSRPDTRSHWKTPPTC